MKCIHKWADEWIDVGAFTTTCYKSCVRNCGAVLMGCAGTPTGEIKSVLVVRSTTHYADRPNKAVEIESLEFHPYPRD